MPNEVKDINTKTGLEVVKAGPNKVKIVAKINPKPKPKPKHPKIICERSKVRPMPLSSGSIFSAKWVSLGGTKLISWAENPPSLRNNFIAC